MRNKSSEILRRVASGESLEISNKGVIAGIIIPANGLVIDALVQRGEVRLARTKPDALKKIIRVSSPTKSTAELVEDARGEL